MVGDIGASLTPFGALLKGHRLAAALTHEVLAERAGVSARTISDLERGVARTPRAATRRLLAEALGLSPEARRAFERAALAAAPHASAVDHPALPALPAQLTAFVGRERELARAGALLEGTRLLTLTGPGGVGKTRLALELAAGVREPFESGVGFVSLTAVGDAGGVEPAIVRGLGLRETASTPAGEALRARLRGQRVLLVLDNCEHLPGVGGVAAGLVRDCPDLTVLATSRAPLRISGEQELPVPPMALPDADAQVTPERANEYDAIRLFVARARQVLPDFALTAQEVPAVVEICRRLDGLPLAIELAAARIRLLPPRELAGRLGHRLRLLTDGPRDAPGRQQTLRDTIAWSYSLLTPGAQTLFARLGVFAGGFDLAAAASANGDEGDEGGNGAETLERLVSLVEHSVVRRAGEAGSGDGSARLALLETIREFALERLEAGGEGPSVRRRHAAHFLALAERAQPELVGAQQARWIERLELEHDNFREALAWCAGDPESGALGLRLAAALWRFWVLRGHVTEGRRWLDQALASAGGCGGGTPGAASDDTAVRAARAAVLQGAGMLAGYQGEYALARARLEESVALWQEGGGQAALADSLRDLGGVALSQGDRATAQGLLEASLRIAHRLGLTWAEARARNTLGLLCRSGGDYAGARTHFEASLELARRAGDREAVACGLLALADAARDGGDVEAAQRYAADGLSIARELGDKVTAAAALHILGDAAWQRRDLPAARAMLEESLAARRQLGNRNGASTALNMLGGIAREEGDLDRARALHGESLAIRWELLNREGVAWCLEALSLVAGAQGEDRRAARLAGAAAALRERIAVPRPPADRQAYERDLCAVRARLGDEAFAALQAEGVVLPLDQAVRYALATGEPDAEWAPE